MGMVLLGTAVTAGAQLYGGYAQKVQGENMAAQQEYNAEVSRLKKAHIEQRGAEAGKVRARQASRDEGTMLSRMAGAGAVPSAGGLALVVAEQAAQDERDQMINSFDTTVMAMEAESEAQGFEIAADVAEQRGENQFYGSMFQAGGTVMKGLYANYS